MSEELFMGHYIKWRAKRIAAIVDFYGASFFKGKTLLEVGCGHAHIGKYFYDLGAKVTVCDDRSEHIEYVNSIYPELNASVVDLDTEFPFEKFDIIIDMGVIYHLSNYRYHMEKVCNLCTWIIMESEVVDFSGIDETVGHSETVKDYDQSLHGLGNRPSIGYIEDLFKRNKFYTYRIDDDRCNSDNHNYNWTPNNTGKYIVGFRKMWFCRKD